MATRVRRRLALAAMVLLVLACRPACDARRAVARPNIFLISVDTLRADRLSSYGHSRSTSPFIDSLAAEGIRFDHAYATSPWTTPSVVSMLTSTYPNRHRMGARFKGVPRSWSRIPDDLPNLASSLRDAGYRTFGLVANANLAADRGFDRGFDRFDCLGTADLDRIEEVIPSWIDEIAASEEPWFFWLHMLDPHAPYVGRRPWLARYAPSRRAFRRLDGLRSERLVQLAGRFTHPQMEFIRALYDSEIRDTDEFLRGLFERLPAADDALVLFTSDHGEEFRDHGRMLHGHSLFDELIRIPFIVRLPDRRFAGTVVDGPVSLVDVLPTLLDAAGVAGETDAAGINLIGPRGARVPDGRQVTAELLRGRVVRATVDGRWKLITRTRQPDRPELYDLVADPLETSNLAADHPELVARLQASQEAFERSHPPLAVEPEQTAITPEQIEALDALGYIDAH